MDIDGEVSFTAKPYNHVFYSHLMYSCLEQLCLVSRVSVGSMFYRCVDRYHLTDISCRKRGGAGGTYSTYI